MKRHLVILKPNFKFPRGLELLQLVESEREIGEQWIAINSLFLDQLILFKKIIHRVLTLALTAVHCVGKYNTISDCTSFEKAEVK